MTTAWAARSSAARNAVLAARGLQDSLRHTPELTTTTSDALLVRNIIAEGPCRSFLGVVGDVDAAADAGHRCELRLLGDAGLTMTWAAGGAPDLVAAEVTVDPRLQDQIRVAADAGDAAALLRLLDDRPARLEVTLSSRHAGLAWIPSIETLVDSLRGASWGSTVIQLGLAMESGHATLVVDGLPAAFSTPALRFVPTPDEIPAVEPQAPPRPGRVSDFEAARRDRGWPALLGPDLLLPDTPGDDELRTVLAATGDASAWAWLAHDPPTVTTTEVVATYRGVRDLELSLLPPARVATGSAVEVLALWQWCATSGDDPVRSDAVSRAISLAVTSVQDLGSAAGPALRTARTLYGLATQGLVTEALSARKTAREAAAAAGRAAALAARDAATKSVERTLAVLVAAAGVVFATLQRVLDWYVSSIGLVVIAIVLLGSLVVTWRIDLAGADGALDAFDTDIELLREALSEDDLTKVKQMAILSSARADVRRARTAASWVYGTGSLLSLATSATLAVWSP